jgi:hypothetical protein
MESQRGADGGEDREERESEELGDGFRHAQKVEDRLSERGCEAAEKTSRQAGERSGIEVEEVAGREDSRRSAHSSAEGKCRDDDDPALGRWNERCDLPDGGD